MQHLMTAISALLSRIKPIFGPAEPIRTTAALAAFLGGRAAYVAQTSLYGYLKTRMGTRYATIFQDPAFEPALTEARQTAFHGCLEDLTIHAVALLRTRVAVTDKVAAKAAEALFAAAVIEAMPQAIAQDPPLTDLSSTVSAPAGLAAARDRFAARLGELDWEQAGNPRVTFRSSQAVLVAAAPVIDSYREADREIIENSVKFRWIDVRRQLGERLDARAVAGCLPIAV